MPEEIKTKAQLYLEWLAKGMKPGVWYTDGGFDLDSWEPPRRTGRPKGSTDASLIERNRRWTEMVLAVQKKKGVSQLKACEDVAAKVGHSLAGLRTIVARSIRSSRR